MEKYTNNDIAMVFNCGQHFRGWKSRFLWFTAIFMLLFPLLTLAVAITVWAGAMDWTKQIIFTFTFGNVVMFALYSIILWILIQNILLRKNISKWLEDAVEVVANVKRLDLLGQSLVAGKIEISFNLDGHFIRAESDFSSKVFAKNRPLMKFLDCKLILLYSPTYDRILIPDRALKRK